MQHSLPEKRLAQEADLARIKCQRSSINSSNKTASKALTKMRFNFDIAALAIVCATANQVMAAAAPAPATNELFSRQGRPVAFNVAPQGACMYPSPALALTDVSNQTSPACGSGTTISCSPSPGNPCKGNFSPAQASVVVTRAAGNCHLNLYPQANQAGGVSQRLNTDTTGTCVFTSTANWRSYGIFCD